MHIPSQECWLLFKTYPTLQEQIKLPTVLVQVCAHGDDKHSSVSVKWYVLQWAIYIHMWMLIFWKLHTMYTHIPRFDSSHITFGKCRV